MYRRGVFVGVGVEARRPRTNSTSLSVGAPCRHNPPRVAQHLQPGRRRPGFFTHRSRTTGKIRLAINLYHQFLGPRVYDHDVGRSFRRFDLLGDCNSVADIIEPVVQDLVDADFERTFDELRRRYAS